jgi:hypothetical protein
MKASFLMSTVAAALLAATSFASAQNENTRQTNPETNAPAGQQPDSSKGLGTGSSEGDKAMPSAPRTTTGQGVVPPAAAPGQAIPPAATTPREPGVVRPSESRGDRPGDRAN